MGCQNARNPLVVDTNAYLTFLLLGAVLVAIDGQIIYRSGRRLLRQSGADAGGAESWVSPSLEGREPYTAP